MSHALCTLAILTFLWTQMTIAAAPNGHRGNTSRQHLRWLSLPQFHMMSAVFSGFFPHCLVYAVQLALYSHVSHNALLHTSTSMLHVTFPPNSRNKGQTHVSALEGAQHTWAMMMMRWWWWRWRWQVCRRRSKHVSRSHPRPTTPRSPAGLMSASIWAPFLSVSSHSQKKLCGCCQTVLIFFVWF